MSRLRRRVLLPGCLLFALGLAAWDVTRRVPASFPPPPAVSEAPAPLANVDANEGTTQGTAGGEPGAAPRSLSEAESGRGAPTERERVWWWDASRVLILGNSLTIHPASAELDWPGEWGMAASSAERDYVHRLAAKLREATGGDSRLRVRNIADFERGYADYDCARELAEDRAFGATLIVLAIGENMDPLAGDAAEQRFYGAVCALLGELTRDQPATVVVRSGFWRSLRRDRALQSAACATSSLFVDCGDLGAVPEHAARSERDFRHGAVGAHPGDRGMEAIAERIWNGLQTNRFAESQARSGAAGTR